MFVTVEEAWQIAGEIVNVLEDQQGIRMSMTQQEQLANIIQKRNNQWWSELNQQWVTSCYKSQGE